MSNPLFLYGTLRHLPLLEILIGGPVSVRPAVLPDHAVTQQADGVLPVLVGKNAALAKGILVEGLQQKQRDILNTYESAFDYLPHPVSVQTEDGRVLVADVYYPPKGVPVSEHGWSLKIWSAKNAASIVNAAVEIAAHDPPLSPAQLRRQWPMIRSRSEAQLRAASANLPATLRYAAKSKDNTYIETSPPAGEFFKMARMEMSHRRFDGAQATGLPREVLVGFDAALVLPYDPVRNRVLLVEQFRTGPARRGDANPWALEPVAGIIDAGETPQRAALREAQEEAGLTISKLTQMFEVYPSPGSSTDYFYCYQGIADLPSTDNWHGGLADEQEDLRLHVLALDAALELIDSGEITTAPLVAMLLWTDRARRSKA